MHDLDVFDGKPLDDPEYARAHFENLQEITIEAQRDVIEFLRQAREINDSYGYNRFRADVTAVYTLQASGLMDSDVAAKTIARIKFTRLVHPKQKQLFRDFVDAQNLLFGLERIAEAEMSGSV